MEGGGLSVELLLVWRVEGGVTFSLEGGGLSVELLLVWRVED